jgi:hypothetical protein
MYAAAKIILPLLIACGSLIAAMESTRPGFIACLGAAFAVGAIAYEILRGRRRRAIRYSPTARSRAILAMARGRIESR